ncbi:hypothetical protein JZ751_004599 [Albula glossodonta]|uniref:Uncharacterized protein n=1 Tax=Albula glossodonta TaxID=121402 RepID=A0A8T2N7T8_9TELE|nr:hypothetical protein JZ751_004599 [Albula glossodonta]
MYPLCPLTRFRKTPCATPRRPDVDWIFKKHRPVCKSRPASNCGKNPRRQEIWGHSARHIYSSWGERCSLG